jgi:thiamine monophosphate kinase
LSKQAQGIEEALCSGEEFELLFTASRDQASRIIKSAKYRFKVIGEIMPEVFGLRLINLENKYSKLKLQGYSAEARTGLSYKAGYQHF